MKTFNQFRKEYYRDYDWRKPDKDGKIKGAAFKTDFDVRKIPVGVDFTRSKDYHGKREYSANFEVDNTFYSPGKWTDSRSLKITRAAPEILKKVSSTIEKFIQEKKPNAIHLSPNEAKKAPLYHAFAKYLAKKYGGKVELVDDEFSEYEGGKSFVVRLPGKQLRENRILNAARAAVKKNWKTKLALAATPLPGTIVAAGAMAVKDAVQAYRGK